MKIVLYGIAGVIVGYLMVVFYEVEFDISTWSAECRYLAIILMILGGGIGAVLCGQSRL